MMYIRSYVFTQDLYKRIRIDIGFIQRTADLYRIHPKDLDLYRIYAKDCGFIQDLYKG